VKVLVTGANGFLGTAVRSRLAGSGHSVIGVSRTKQAGIVVADLASVESVMPLLNDTRPDVVVNCAATVDFGVDLLPKLFAVNVLLPALLGQWCQTAGGYLVQASTVTVHGVKTREAGPDTPVQPDTEYGRSKWLAECNIDSSGCQAVCLRFGGLFGRSGPEHLGLNRALRAAARGDPPILVGTGSAKRNYVFVHDAAAVIAYCVQARPSGVRWVGGSQVLSLRQMLDTICDVYLPGTRPVIVAGSEAADQFVQHSRDLPTGLGFREALERERAS
jgi:nucleoside-diphosphate-sugar epimerase